MKSKTIRNLSILGFITIFGIISVQIYWITQALNLQKKEFQNSVFISLRNVAKDISKYNKMDFPIENPVKQISSDYYIVNIREAIDVNILQLYLKQEFSKYNLRLDYEFAIYDCLNDKMVYGKYVSFDYENEDQLSNENLPKYNQFTYYFGVHFPKINSYLLASNKLWIFFTVILFFSILFFVYSINIILKQKRLSELQKNFINNMTHEFKTPISTINIASKALNDNNTIKLDKNLSNYSSIIFEQNQRLNLQIEKILEIAKIEREKIKLKKELINLNEIIKTIINSVNLSLIELNAKVILNLSNDDIFIKCDKIHLSNVLYNIIDNALKYSQPNPKITIETLFEKNHATIKVSDNGVGIPKEFISKVSNKFFRVPTGKIHNVKGFGLGLFYVNEICKAHNWTWKINSTENSGTEITFKI